MLIRIGYDIEIDLPTPTEILYLLHVHPTIAHRLRKPEDFQVEPAVKTAAYTDAFGNLAGLLKASAGRIRFWNDAIIEDSGEPDARNPEAEQHAVCDLPPEVTQFLLGSRYCDVDSELADFAWTHFASAPSGWARVQAICDFVHSHLVFDYMRARSTRTASETFHEQTGVCRDFTHLAITFCRCMNIPARYTTGYLGDIRIPPTAPPMDFSAWFEVFLGGEWRTFDARHNVPRAGRVVMAYGRDAADCALTTIFGPHGLAKFNVWADEISRPKAPMLSQLEEPTGSAVG